MVRGWGEERERGREGDKLEGRVKRREKWKERREGVRKEKEGGRKKKLEGRVRRREKWKERREGITRPAWRPVSHCGRRVGPEIPWMEDGTSLSTRLESCRPGSILSFAVVLFSRSSHTSDLKNDNPVAALPGAWRYRVKAWTGWPGVSILRLGEIESLIRNCSPSVATRTIS